jgi:hypothetical protein
MRFLCVWCALLSGCGDDATATDGGPAPDGSRPRADAGPLGPGQDAGQTGTDAGVASGDALSDRYPGDENLGSDPSVVWFEDFEGGTLETIGARYDQFRAPERMELVTDTVDPSSAHALALRAGNGVDAVDFYKQLPEHDELFIRWYARYERNAPWHHSGVWFGGYNPGMRWPSPMAGSRPNGDDRFSISIEPVFGEGDALRFDFYNYWRGMHSWMAEPVDDNGMAFWGNALVHQNSFTVDPGSWVCIEVHTRLNPDPSNGDGAMLEVWKNDALVASFTDSTPLGYWIRDKYCPEGADGRECTDYPAPATVPLDLQFRNDPSLRLNAFWPQNYITDSGEGTLAFDQMVVATERVGCMR